MAAAVLGMPQGHVQVQTTLGAASPASLLHELLQFSGSIKKNKQKHRTAARPL